LTQAEGRRAAEAGGLSLRQNDRGSVTRLPAPGVGRRSHLERTMNAHRLPIARIHAIRRPRGGGVS